MWDAAFGEGGECRSCRCEGSCQRNRFLWYLKVLPEYNFTISQEVKFIAEVQLGVLCTKRRHPEIGAGGCVSGRRELLWDSMIESEMLAVYWQFQLERETAYSNAMRLAIGIASSGTIATLWLFEGHADIQKGVPALAGILSIAYAAFFPPERFSKAANLITTFNELAAKYRILWAEDEYLAEEQHWQEYQRLALTKVDQTGFKQRQSLLDRALEQAESVRSRKMGEKQ